MCGDLTSAFDFAQADPRPVRLPGTGGYEPPDRDRHPDYVPPVPADPTLPVQERGRRHTRPLAYQPFVDAHVQGSKVTLTFGAGPGAGGAFHVTAANRADGPWTYTTEAAKTVADTWNGTPYDLSVFGPNGFLRTFAGAAPVADVTARHDGRAAALTLTMRNTSASTITLAVTDAYGGQKTFTLRRNESATYPVDTGRGDRWYDVTVTCDKDKAFRRRFAGHVENGRPGLSDPAIRTH